MPAVTLTKTWITLGDDLTQSVVVRRTQGGRTSGVDGDVRTYANGRLRVVTRAARPGTVTLAFRAQNTTDIDTLRSWAGRTVLVRDPRGRGDWCVFLTVQETDSAPTWIDVQIPLTFVTHSIEV